MWLNGIISAMNLSTLGEFNLIALIKDAVQHTQEQPSEAAQRMRIGIGDDAAVWVGSDLLQLCTTDAMIENVHFAFSWCSWEDLGYKSLAVNLSDIAAMGGQPHYALVSLSCPGNVQSEAILDYYRGMTHLAVEHGVVIIGGNLTTSPLVTSTVVVMGESTTGAVLQRSCARRGDVVAVTGTLGAAAAALHLLTRDAALPRTEVPEPLMCALVRPHARLAEGQALNEEGVECAIDISDGLLSDLNHICESSLVSATVRSHLLPISTECHTLVEDPLPLALTGGEAYELLFTCRPSMFPRVADRLNCPVTVIGEIGTRTESPGVTVLGRDGLPIEIRHTGWRHFTP